MSINPILAKINKVQLKADLPAISVGDSVDVHTKIIEGGKERIQVYKGTVLKLQNSGLTYSITVRRVFQGIGIERTFLLHSPKIAKVVITRKGHVRRAKLYYLRERTGKATKVKEKVSVAAE